MVKKMSKSTVGNDYYDDLDWDDDIDFDDRVDEKNNAKKKQISRKLKIKRRMDDYIEAKKEKMRARYLDSYDDLNYD